MSTNKGVFVSVFSVVLNDVFACLDIKGKDIMNIRFVGRVKEGVQ